MSIDLSEFHDIFFEECFEGLSVMETGLISLDDGTDVEEINSIFRAAHSIKGGGASFGFLDISKFTHVMETLLDEMRDGRRVVTRDIVDLLLESVDILRDMVTAAKDGDDAKIDQAPIVQAKLEQMLAGGEGVESAGADDTDSESTEANPLDAPDTFASGWRIKFKPDQDMLKNGNDPIRIIRELETLGEIHVVSDSSKLPELKDIDPESIYISWVIDLQSDVDESVLRELFSWVEDECELEIFPLQQGADAAEDLATESTQEAEVAPTAVEEKPAPAESKGVAKKKPATNKDNGSIRVSIDKIDALINMVGELVITQSMLSQISTNLEESRVANIENLMDGITLLERNTRELQESVLQIRMLPISFSFSRFPRLVRDLSKSMGKNIELKMTGEHTEVDKNVLEKIGDPLVHLVRNSLDHGIETPEVRVAAGKSEVGILELCAYHEGGDIIIQVIDDGAGLSRDRIVQKAVSQGLVSENEELTDEKIYNMIFMPGFSTAEVVSDVSGRGVGMDVVRRNVRDLGGNVSIASNPGAGSTVTIRLPLTLAILDGQLVRIGKETYIISLVSIVESLQMQPNFINCVAGQSELYRLRDEYIPIIRINDLFEMNDGINKLEEGLLVIVESDGQRVGLFVDDLLGQQQVVIKSLETNFTQVQGVSGATILGDGTVALIMDVPGLLQRHFESIKTEGDLDVAA